MNAASPSSKRHWPLVAAILGLAASIHLLRREPAAPARDERETPTVAPEAPATRGAAAANTAPDPPLEAPSPGAAPEEVARTIVGALPQGEREAQRLQVLEVEALVRSGRVGSARARAAAYFERWPGGPDTAALETLTGAHPRVDRPSP